MTSIVSTPFNLPAVPPYSSNQESVCIADFSEKSEEICKDTTPALREALAYCKKNKVAKLVFPAGTYHFKRDLAEEELLYVSNNDSGLKRIAFRISGFKDFEIDGGGAHFIFQGFVVPFLIEDSEQIVLKNFTIDFERTFHSEGKVLAVNQNSVDVSFGSEFPYEISHGLLRFIGKSGDEKTEYPAWSVLEFDTQKRETAYMAHDYFFNEKRQATELSPGKVRVQVEGIKATPGNTLVFCAAHRLVPGIIIQDSSDLKLFDLTIHHCGGMGVIAQRSRNLALERIKVTPPRGRMLSTTADATHFTHCSGKISLIDCLFENQSDDATNIHGIYAKITRKLSPNELEVRLVHFQQYGFDFLRAGTKVELVNKENLVTLGTGTVESMERLNGEYSKITFETPLPPELKIQDLVSSAEDIPEVLIQGCTIRNNRARGILLGSKGPILIENNHFHSPGAAILLEGDGSFWFEQAGVKNLTIRRNTFDNCNFGVWGKAVIEVGAGIEKDQRGLSRYNSNLVIEDNLFRVFDSVPFILGYSIDGLVFRKNRVETTSEYPPARTEKNRFEITDSSNISIED